MMIKKGECGALIMHC